MFDGCTRVWTITSGEQQLPAVSEGQPLAPVQVEAEQHFTKPPARFTEASLVKALEREGIGRPSTYASIISTIQDREYVIKKSGALLPTYIGMAVVFLLREHFPRYVNIKFTAQMESDLDKIGRGEIDWVDFLGGFYRGNDQEEGLVQRIEEQLPQIGYPTIPLGTDPSTGQPVVVRIGRNYVYVQVDDDEQRRATLPVDLLIDELNVDKAIELIAERARSREPIGQHPESGENIYALSGPYGPYLQLGEGEGDRKPKRIGLGRGTDPKSVDLEMALKLLALPRSLGNDPESGKEVTAGLGRFGPYVQCERVFANVQSVDLIFTISRDEALERIRNKNKKPVLKELGPHPETGEPLRVLKGRYGPYVTDGKLNANVGKDNDPLALTVEEALQLLAGAAERKKNKPGKKKATKKTTTKKKTTKKKTAKKTTKKTAKKTEKKAAKQASTEAAGEPEAARSGGGDTD